MMPPTEQIDPERYLALVMALAKEGNAKAQHNLGALYLKGLGVPNDPALAAEWFTKAGDQDEMQSQHNLGILYLRGIGVPRDPRRAFVWFRRAALQGDSKSAHCLGSLYAEGVGVKQDLVRAYIWWSRAMPGVPEPLQEQIHQALDVLRTELDPQSISYAEERIHQVLSDE
ncbi:MAG: sel1 repeat family protein [Magnetococcus sp. YQC-5]